MPNRLIKESICVSEKINSLSDFNFRLWVTLITYVDDFGRGDARAAVIKGRCFPLRERVTVKDVEAGLHVLADTGCILLYEADGDSYLCFPNWDKHQTVRNQKSKYPAPPAIENNCKQLQAIASKCSRNPIQSESISESISESKTREAEVIRMFNQFWEEYPKKVAKQDAFKAWTKIKPDEALFAKIMEGLARWKKSDQWTRDGGRYIPNAATWLNGCRWEDEVPVAIGQKSPAAQSYEQRDYSGVQGELEAQQDAEMEEYMASERGTA